MKKYLFTLTLFSGALFLNSGCTTTADRELRQEVRAEAPADSPDQIMGRAAKAFSNAPGLTTEQKIRLGAVYSQVYTEAMQIRRDIGQSKSLLFRKLAKVDYKNSEIVNLKKRIVQLDQRRLDLMFKALEDVQDIVGQGEEAERIYKHFEDYEIPRRIPGDRETY